MKLHFRRTTLATLVLGALLTALAWPVTVHAVWKKTESTITKTETELRDGPSADAPTLAQLPAKTALIRLTERSGPWIQVQTRPRENTQGAVGWVHMFDVTSPKGLHQGSTVATGALRNMSYFFTHHDLNTQNPDSPPATALLGVRSLGKYDGFRSQPDRAAVDQFLLLRTDPLAPLSNNLLRGTDLLFLLTRPLNQIDTPDELEIGQQLCAVVLDSQTLHPDKALQRYVNQLGRWISQQSARPNLPWTFAVLDDSSAHVLSAPGGYVLVTKGLIDAVANEAELAGLLALEITHVTEKHHLKALQQAISTSLVPPTQINMVRDMYIRGFDHNDAPDTVRTAMALAARAGFEVTEK